MNEIILEVGEVYFITCREGDTTHGSGYFMVESSQHGFDMIDLEQSATKLGQEHGKNAGAWYFDGREVDGTYALKTVLTGISDGDPLVMDTLPRADLSGQWAEGMTPGKLLAELGISESLDSADQSHNAQLLWSEMESHICDLYCSAFNEAAQHAVEKEARWRLGMTDERP